MSAIFDHLPSMCVASSVASHIWIIYFAHLVLLGTSVKLPPCPKSWKPLLWSNISHDTGGRLGWITQNCSCLLEIGQYWYYQSQYWELGELHILAPILSPKAEPLIRGDIFSILCNSRGIRKTFSWPAVWNWLNSNKETWWGFMTWAIRIMKAVLHHVMAFQMTWILYGIYTCYRQLPVKSIVVVLDKEDISQHPRQILYIIKHWSFTKFLKLQEAITHHIWHLSANRGIARLAHWTCC